MDISTDRRPSEANRPGSYSDVWQSLRNIIRRLVEWLTVTDEDRIRAGIYIRRPGA
jgi:hypothetical protein